MMMGGPGSGGGPGVFVLNKNTKRDRGRKAQLTNIEAGKTVAGIIRTTLGPRAMLKMLLDPMGGIVMTNDGNAILREVDVVHPTAKSMIELCRAQDEEVGDGTTSVMVLCGEMMGVAEPLLKKSLHPTVIVGGYMEALQLVQGILDEIALDLYVLRLLAPLQTRASNLASKLPTYPEDIRLATELVDEWGRGFVAETDYRYEAANTEAFSAAMERRGLGAVTSPSVVRELSTSCVITTE